MAPQPTPHPRIARRTALQAGAIGLLGLGTDTLARLQAAAQDPQTAPTARARSVIFIFLSGGLSQFESFDMKPDAPPEIRGEFRPIPTNTPGLHICEHLPRLARRSHLWALCRSLTHGTNEHSQGHHIMLTGRSDLPPNFDPRQPRASDWPAIAAVSNRVLAARGNLPPAIVLPEKLVHRTGRTIPGQFAGSLGDRWNPFFLESSPSHPASYGAFPDYLFHHREGQVPPDGLTFRDFHLALPEGLPFERLRDRLTLRSLLEPQHAGLENAARSIALDRYGEMAVSLLADPKTQAAFNVHQADDALQERYGKNAFGWSLLLARQLVEAGVRLVQVNLGNNETWDTHEAAFPNLRSFLLPPLDQSVSALLDDLQERGLLDETLVVMASEFGRTPRIFTIPGARLPGRDHWGAAQTVWLAGGGIRGGAVLGATDRLGNAPSEAPQRPEDFAATLYHALGIPPSASWEDLGGRPFPVYHGRPWESLFG